MVTDRKEWDYSKLKGRIKEKYDTQQKFVEALGILSDTSITYKLSNQTEFKQSEIYKIMKILEIDDSEIKAYFFIPKVEKSQPI